MSRLAGLMLRRAHLAFLRCVSWFVPAAQRAEWRQEWASELTYAHQTCAPVQTLSWKTAHKLTCFCLGSFQDALCLRRMQPKEWIPSVVQQGSARRCILWLGAIVVFCAAVAWYLPGIRIQNDAAQKRVGSGVILIQSAPDGQSIPFRAYRNWNSVRQRFFTSLAFYWTEDLPATRATNQRRTWRVALASNDLFEVVGVEPITDSVDEGNQADLSRAVLSQSAWREDFDSNPAVVGSTQWVAGRRVWIVGIAPDDTWRIPDKPDLWILESDAQLARESPHASGYVIAQLSSQGQRMMMGDAVRISGFAPDGEAIDLFGATLAVPATGTFSLYVFAFFLAILAMPAVTSVFQSDSEIASHRPSFSIRLRGWAFLGTKFALVAALGYFGASDVAYCCFPGYSPSAELLQLFGAFGICLAGLRWAVMDQSRRCPVCLRMVTHPAKVGIASCSFLGWNGTEMVCMGGHVLLHVPNLPTSWFSRQRWTYLDKSWDFLFATAAGRF
jgi:hypothetical protein